LLNIYYRYAVGEFNKRNHLSPDSKYYLEPVPITSFYEIVRLSDASSYVNYLAQDPSIKEMKSLKEFYQPRMEKGESRTSGQLIKENQDKDNRILNNQKPINKSGIPGIKSDDKKSLKDAKTGMNAEKFIQTETVWSTPLPKHSNSAGFGGMFMPTNCTQLAQALSDYNSLSSGIYPPLTLWLNHYFGTSHTYAYYYNQIVQCSLQFPSVGASCISLDQMVTMCRDNNGLAAIVPCLNNSLGIDFSLDAQ